MSAMGDGRSTPSSRRNPQGNRASLQHELARHPIASVFLGEAQGARSSDASCDEGGTVHSHRLATTDAFRRGLALVEHGIQRDRVALICTEKGPLACHRTILIGRYLTAPEVSMRHRLADGRLEPHDTSERRLVTCVLGKQGDRGQDGRAQLECADDLQAQRIASTPRPTVGR
jgi:hypothetical protein